MSDKPTIVIHVRKGPGWGSALEDAETVVFSVTSDTPVTVIVDDPEYENPHFRIKSREKTNIDYEVPFFGSVSIDKPNKAKVKRYVSKFVKAKMLGEQHQ